jgi:hypothetical protein
LQRHQIVGGVSSNIIHLQIYDRPLKNLTNRQLISVKKKKKNLNSSTIAKTESNRRQGPDRPTDLKMKFEIFMSMVFDNLKFFQKKIVSNQCSIIDVPFMLLQM